LSPPVKRGLQQHPRVADPAVADGLDGVWGRGWNDEVIATPAVVDAGRAWPSQRGGRGVESGSECEPREMGAARRYPQPVQQLLRL